MTSGLDNLTSMAVFATVVDANSFSAAAAQLGLSKSAVSKQVSSLERRLGTQLLNRTTRRLGLTEAGAALYERCARIMSELADAQAELGQMHGQPRGLLRVSAPVSFGKQHIAPQLGHFLRENPEVHIDLSLSDRFVDLIEERFDCAVRVAQLPDSSLMARRLAPARRVVCGSPAYFKRHGLPHTPDDLRQHNCLQYSYLASSNGWPFAGPNGNFTVRVAGNLETNNGDVLREAALNGVGIALIPTFMIGDDLRAGRLQAVLTEFDGWQASVYAVYPATRHVAPKVRAFVDYFAKRCNGTPYWDKGLSFPARSAADRRQLFAKPGRSRPASA